MEFTAAITHDGYHYVAQCLDVDVVSQGVTVDAALANLREALELYFEDMPPPPGSEAPLIVNVQIAA